MVTNIGNATPYVSSGGFIQPPTATDILYRKAHPEQKSKPRGLDWDALTPVCPTCQQKSGQIDGTGLCPPCRGVDATPEPEGISTTGRGNYLELDADDVERRFTPPDNTRLGQDLTELEATDPRVAAAAANYKAMVERITRPEDHIQAPRPTPTVRAKVTRTSPHDITITLRSTNDPIDQVAVAALLHDLLTALTTTPQSPAAATHTAAGPSEGQTRLGKTARPSDTPRARRDRITLPSPDVEDAYTAGATLRELADHYNVSHPTISRHLDDHGITRRKQRVNYTPQLIGDVRRLYLDDQLNQDQVAERLGVTTKVVQTAMDKGNIPARESAVARSKRGIGHAIKIPHADHPHIVDRYRAGESAPSIARDYDASATAIYAVLRGGGITEFHGNKTLAGPGKDGSAPLRDRITALGVTSADIKRWAVDNGHLPPEDRSKPGLPSQALVDAYTAAHPERAAS